MLRLYQNGMIDKAVMKKLIDQLKKLALRDGNFKTFPSAVEQNKELLAHHKIDWNTSVKCGAMGCMLDTHTPEWIIKLTCDPHEAALFATVRDEKIRSGFVHVKEIYTLQDETFIIIKQRITPLYELSDRPDYNYITAQYMNFMHVYYQEMNDVTQKRKSISRAITAIRRHTFDEVVDIFLSLRKLAYRGYKLLDIDLDNIGYTSENQLVIFDAQLESL